MIFETTSVAPRGWSDIVRRIFCSRNSHAYLLASLIWFFLSMIILSVNTGIIQVCWWMRIILRRTLWFVVSELEEGATAQVTPDGSLLQHFHRREIAESSPRGLHSDGWYRPIGFLLRRPFQMPASATREMLARDFGFLLRSK